MSYQRDTKGLQHMHEEGSQSSCLGKIDQRAGNPERTRGLFAWNATRLGWGMCVTSPRELSQPGREMRKRWMDRIMGMEMAAGFLDTRKTETRTPLLDVSRPVILGLARRCLEEAKLIQVGLSLLAGWLVLQGWPRHFDWNGRLERKMEDGEDALRRICI